MATRINIRGLIVGSEYDDEWFADYIEKGIITPESTFRKALAAADGDDVEIYISSQGGSFVAGSEMANAIHDYAGNKVVTLGAFAASMAANIALTAGCPVRAYSNSILLYHGAWSVCIGGSDAMTDEATILDQINAPIMAALIEHGVPRATVERGFSEGRVFTMGAREALAYGIVSEILDGSGESPARVDPDAVATIQEHAASLPAAAAFAWQDGEAPDGDTRSQLFDALDALAAIRAEHVSTLATVSDLEHERDALRSERDNLASTLEQARKDTASALARANTLQASLDRSRAAHAALTGRVLAPEETPGSWLEAVAKYGTETALQRFPALAAEYRARKSTKQPNTNQNH